LRRIGPMKPDFRVIRGFIAEIFRKSRARVRNVGYMGWFPKVAQSGTSLNASRLADDGVRLGRNVLGRMALTFLAPRVRETPFRLYHERLVARGMKPSVALGHMAGKLASVLYECLKTQTPYDETRHRKQMGLPVGDDTTAGVVIEVPDAEIDTSEVSSEPPSLP
jgi:hypothetical protein